VEGKLLQGEFDMFLVFSSSPKQMYSGEFWKLLIGRSKVPVWKLLKAADLFLTQAEVKLLRLL
jgi:hypothetical protein